jgi:phosphatidylcholine synthase
VKPEKNVSVITWKRRVAGWLVHIFTASGAYIGLLALLAIHQGKLLTSFWLMGTTIVIDAVDGLFARMVKVKIVVPNIDGALLDNIVDFFTYTMIPAFFLLTVPLVPPAWRFCCVIAVTFSSAYQFTQVDAKTEDHFFKGFPSYWNIVVLYLFLWQMNQWINLGIIFLLAVLSFVPIKYVYPSRLDYLSHSVALRMSMLFATIIWGCATFGLLWIYPKTNITLVALSMGYLLLYVGISLYRTWRPLFQTHGQQTLGVDCADTS